MRYNVGKYLRTLYVECRNLGDQIHKAIVGLRLETAKIVCHQWNKLAVEYGRKRDVIGLGKVDAWFFDLPTQPGSFIQLVDKHSGKGEGKYMKTIVDLKL